MNFKQASLISNGTLKEIKHGVWEVTEQFIWYIDFKTKNEYIIIPKGFRTNLGSIPRVFRWLIDYTWLSFCLHDYLYSNKGKIIVTDISIIDDSYHNISIGGDEDYVIPTRKEADQILEGALQVEGMQYYKTILVYIAVRLFGFLYFKNK